MDGDVVTVMAGWLGHADITSVLVPGRTDHPSTLIGATTSPADRAAGRLDQAIPLCERVAADRAADAARRPPQHPEQPHNRAFAYQAAGRLTHDTE